MNDRESDRTGELEAQLQAGNASALGPYFDNIRPQLLAFVERQLGSQLRRKIEAEDILQDAGIEAMRQYEKNPQRDQKPFSWLCQIAERKIIDAHRHHFGAQKRDAGREKALDVGGGQTGRGDFMNMLIMSITTPSQAFSRNAREARLADAVGQLPEEQRDAIRLRYVENLPSKEIAQRLGKSDASVRIMLSRSIRQLQTLLGDDPSMPR